MSRRAPVLAALLIVAGSFGMAAPVAAATPDAVDDGPIVVQKNAAAATINVLANDTAAVDAAITGATDPVHGTVAIAGNGRSLTYQPDAGYVGSDTFTYTVTDLDATSDTATVTIRVNAPPVAVDDPPLPSCDESPFSALVVTEDFGPFDVAGPCSAVVNDSDSDGSIASWQIDSLPAHGTLLWSPIVPGVFRYTPAANFSTPYADPLSDSLSDAFTYHVIDNNGASSNVASYPIFVAPVNDPPTVTAGPFVTSAEDTPYSAPWATAITPGPNEPDQTVHFERGQTTHLSGFLVFTDEPAISPDGTLSYTPAPNSNGWVTVSFVAKDDGGLANPGNATPPPNDTSQPFIVDITVTAANDPPVAVTDAITVAEDSGPTSALNVRGNDTDPEGDTLSITQATNGTKGTAAVVDDGQAVTYAPAPDAFGPDSFTYTVSDGHGGTATGTVNVTITGAEDAPIAGDDVATVAEDSTDSVVDVLVNDDDVDGDALTISAKTDGAQGTVAITAGGTGLTYTPDPNANGPDSFTYTIDDGNGGTATAAVSVTITAVSDPPDGVDDTPPTIAQDAGPVTVDVLANDIDVDGDTLTITSTTAAAKGTVAITAGGTAVTYHPNQGANGADVFTYTISDGNGGSDTATVNVAIAPDTAPDAVDDGPAVVGEDSGANAIDVLGNDTDPESGDNLSVTATTDGAKGTVTITGGGTGVTYTPNVDANGADAFTYTIDDGHGLTDTATVVVTISAAEDAPVAGDDSLTVTEDQSAASAVLDPLGNDGDIDGDALTITDRTNGAKGVVTITGGGAGVSYKPNANAFGSDAFTYTIDDGHGGTDTATVNVTINPVNDAPNAVNDGVPTPIRIWLHAGAQSVKVLLNDTSLPDGPETLKITKVTQGSHGAVAITGGGTGLTYNPSGSTTGVDLFKYTISDGHGGTDTATVQVSVAKDGTLPKATITGLVKTAIRGSTKLRLTLTWTLTDSGSGLRSQLLQRRTDSGSWVTVTLASLSTRTAGFSMSRGHLYTFRIRGVDRSGNVGLFAVKSIRI